MQVPIDNSILYYWVNLENYTTSSISETTIKVWKPILNSGQRCMGEEGGIMQE